MIFRLFLVALYSLLPGAAYTTSCARAAGCWTPAVAPPSIMGRRQERSRGREIRVAVEDEDEDHSHNIPHQKQRQSRRRRSERTKDNEDDGYDMRPDSLFSSGPFVVLRLFVTALLTVVLVASVLLAWRRRRVSSADEALTSVIKDHGDVSAYHQQTQREPHPTASLVAVHNQQRSSPPPSQRLASPPWPLPSVALTSLTSASPPAP